MIKLEGAANKEETSGVGGVTVGRGGAPVDSGVLSGFQEHGKRKELKDRLRKWRADWRSATNEDVLVVLPEPSSEGGIVPGSNVKTNTWLHRAPKAHLYLIQSFLALNSGSK